MSELKNSQCASEDLVDEAADVVKETDPFASLIKMLEENPEFRSTYESVMSVLGEEATEEEGAEVECVEIDGHDFDQIYDAVENAKKSSKPAAIIANTIKGKGVSFMENNAGWHGKAPGKDDYEKAMKELI